MTNSNIRRELAKREWDLLVDENMELLWNNDKEFTVEEFYGAAKELVSFSQVIAFDNFQITSHPSSKGTLLIVTYEECCPPQTNVYFIGSDGKLVNITHPDENSNDA